MHILGISAYYHDSAAALIRDGVVVAAAQEERFSRKKHDAAFPLAAARFCLDAAGDAAIDHVVFYDKPLLKFERILETYLAHAPRGFPSFRAGLPIWAKEKLFQRSLMMRELEDLAPGRFPPDTLLFSEHHLSHAASAFFPSPFEEALVLTMDGVGEWATTSVAIGRGAELKIVRELEFPHSLGLLYSAFTTYCGFRVNSGEYKLMGLAPYGEPKYVDLIYNELLDLKEDGTFRLNMDYFNYCAGLTMTNSKFDKLFGAPPRKPESSITQKEMDLAASIQKITEDVVIRLAKTIRKETGCKYLCMAGGVALNCVANGELLRAGIFDDIWIQPAAGDAGGALGSALAVWHELYKGERKTDHADSMKGSYLGPRFEADDIRIQLGRANAVYTELEDGKLMPLLAGILANDKVVGWFQGRMEFGPRALGGRSIIGNPQSSKMQSQMNLKIKYRESFRPFAPSVLYEDVQKYFDQQQSSPYMLIVAPVKEEVRIPMTEEQKNLFGIEKLNIPRSQLPAVTHVDYSGLGLPSAARQ